MTDYDARLQILTELKVLYTLILKDAERYTDRTEVDYRAGMRSAALRINARIKVLLDEIGPKERAPKR